VVHRNFDRAVKHFMLTHQMPVAVAFQLGFHLLSICGTWCVINGQKEELYNNRNHLLYNNHELLDGVRA
jgi:hypothetical protein